jgi:acyl carrier protein
MVWLLAVIPALVLAAVLWCRAHRRITLEAAERWRKRPIMADGEFLKRCGVADELLKADVALAIRRVIAELGTVPAATIRPDDSFYHDLVQLPFWDSLDWVELIMCIEEEFDARVPDSVIDDAMKLAGGYHADLRVEHVVQAVVTAVCQPKKAMLDEDW